MSRYIDADNFYASQAARCWGEPIIGTCTSDKALLYDELQKLPISDVVEVIRCKDCKHYKKINYDDISQNTCEITTKRQQPYDYCSYGERMDGKDGETE